MVISWTEGHFCYYQSRKCNGKHYSDIRDCYTFSSYPYCIFFILPVTRRVSSKKRTRISGRDRMRKNQHSLCARDISCHNSDRSHIFGWYGMSFLLVVVNSISSVNNSYINFKKCYFSTLIET
jgi:hypothetical protein